jgi:hypothetical protein
MFAAKPRASPFCKCTEKVVSHLPSSSCDSKSGQRLARGCWYISIFVNRLTILLKLLNVILCGKLVELSICAYSKSKVS